MQRLRSTFKRSRTPTGAEMKSQSSLEVPKQIRSASFDEIQLEAKRQDEQLSSSSSTTTTTTPSTSKLSEKNRISTLRVPKSGQRSKSFDIYEKTSLIPSSPSARSSGSSGSRKSDTSSLAQYTGCYHCACVKAYKAQFLNRDNDSDSDLNNDPYIDYDYHDDDDDDDDDENNNDNQEEDDDDDDNNYQSSYGINYHVDNYGHDDDDDDDDNDAAYEDIDDDVSLPIDDSIESDEKHEKHEKHEKQPRDSSSPEIRVTLINFDDNKVKKKNITIPNDYYPGGGIDRPRRLSRQEAVISFPLELPSINAPDDDDDDNNNNNICNKNGVYNDDDDDDDDEDEDGDDDDDDDDDDDEDDGSNNNNNKNNNKFKLVVGDIFLTVPELKRDRAASVDSCFNNNKNNKSDCSNSLAVPQQNTRSKSVDIVLPTDQQTRYTALLPNKDQRTRGGKEERPAASGDRELRTTPDWGPGSINGEHLWVSTSASGDFCYVTECSKHGERLKCAACRVSAHKYCLPKLDFDCKAGYRDVGVRQYREQTSTDHHWVHRRSQKGKCTNCSKSFQSKLSFSSKEIVAVICSWCKLAYHNKEACFNVDKVGENCELGLHKSIIVPPSWILKLPRKGSFKSSLRKSPKKIKQSSASGGASGSGSCTTSSKRKKTKKDNNDNQDNNDKKNIVTVDYNTVWMIKPIPSLTVHPLLVFINPKSGGNQGAKLLQKFQWFLNPRQVFDLTQGGPRMGLELFKKVPNLRVLACGGDGTVGWVLSIIDLIDISPSPAVGVLPLGTGNDLARSLGWGGGYTDEPITKILTHLDDSGIRLLDRWSLKVTPNSDGKNDDTTGRVKDNLPLNVVNNYFSLGVDAHIALEFHEAREANPEKFNSRMRNKVFYGQMGGKDLIVRRWKDLSDYVTLECDGIDITPKLIEHRVHAIVFLNISSYGGGTRPWTPMPDTKEPSTDDGLIEVIGLTTFQLPLLQAGGHGTPLAQCSRAVLTTKKTIPMQVDGEACRVLPSIIEMNHLNKATMLTKRRSTRKSHQSIDVKLENLTLPLMKIKMSDYEAYNSDKDRLKKTAIRLKTEPLELEATIDLETLRNILSKEFQMDYCCFLDSCTAERFFRIDVAQEHLHYVTDVISEAIYILEEDPNVIAAIKSALDDKNKDEEIINQVIQQQQKKLTSDCKITSGDKQTSTSPTNKNQKTPIKDNNNKYNQTKTSPKETASSSSSSKYLSSAERLFSLSGNVNTTSSGLLEKTTDGIVHCAKTGDLKKIKDYHERGYSLMSIDSNGQTALHIAAKNGHRDIVQYLISYGPPSMINMLDNDKGQTALHKAVQHKNRSICFILVAAGSTLIVRDKIGKTPRDYANEMGETNLAIYLQNQEEFQVVGESMQKLP